LIEGELIYLQSGRGGPVAVAVNKNSGQIAWRSQASGMGSYAHPIIADVEGVRQLVVFAADGPIAMDPATGKTIWQQPWKTEYDINASDPVYHAGHLFVTSNYGRGAMMLKLSKVGAQKVWETKDVMGRFQPAILDQEHLYVNSEGTLKCLTWPTKDVKWATGSNEKNLLGLGGSIVRVGGDKMILLSQSGRLTLMRVSPQGAQRISDVPDFVEGREVWAMPAIHNGRLYARGEHELVCIDIKGK
jgi:outer membrane protein assembly factor BamB